LYGITASVLSFRACLWTVRLTVHDAAFTAALYIYVNHVHVGDAFCAHCQSDSIAMTL